MNSVALVGRIATEPTLRFTNSGIPVTSFRIAVPREYGDKGQADFYTLVAWRENAEYACNRLYVGDQVSIEARLSTREINTTEDGVTRTSTVVEIVVNKFKLLSRPKRNYEAASQPSLFAGSAR